MDRRPADLSPAVYLGLAFIPILIQVTVRLLDPELTVYKTIFNGEMGVIELGTAFLLLAATVMLAQEARRESKRGERANAILFGVLALGAFLFMGEEISWGQWFFRWDSPEWFQQYNQQGETNLHNLEFVKKDIPKWIVVLGIGYFGLIMPLLRKGGDALRPGGRVGPFDARVLPTHVCVPIAAIVVVTHLTVKFLWWFAGLEVEHITGIDLREANEFYIAMFGLIYTLSVRKRFDAARALPAGR